MLIVDSCPRIEVDEGTEDRAAAGSKLPLVLVWGLSVTAAGCREVPTVCCAVDKIRARTRYLTLRRKLLLALLQIRKEETDLHGSLLLNEDFSKAREIKTTPLPCILQGLTPHLPHLLVPKDLQTRLIHLILAVCLRLLAEAISVLVPSTNNAFSCNFTLRAGICCAASKSAQSSLPQ